jgi:hypothetical protein
MNFVRCEGCRRRVKDVGLLRPVWVGILRMKLCRSCRAEVLRREVPNIPEPNLKVSINV